MDSAPYALRKRYTFSEGRLQTAPTCTCEPSIPPQQLLLHQRCSTVPTRECLMTPCLQVLVEPHRHEGIFISRGKEDALVTKNMVPGESVYGEKRVSVEVRSAQPSPSHSIP